MILRLGLMYNVDLLNIAHPHNLNAISGSKSKRDSFNTFSTIPYFFNNLDMRPRSCRYEIDNIIEIARDSDVHLLFALLKFIELIYS